MQKYLPTEEVKASPTVTVEENYEDHNSLLFPTERAFKKHSVQDRVIANISQDSKHDLKYLSPVKEEFDITTFSKSLKERFGRMNIGPALTVRESNNIKKAMFVYCDKYIAYITDKSAKAVLTHNLEVVVL